MANILVRTRIVSRALVLTRLSPSTTMRLHPAIALLASVATTSALLAQRLPEVEPNGTNATAQPIAIGAQIDCSLVAAEQDWFSFTVAAPGRIRIHTTAIDTRIALLDGAGATYLAIDDDGRGSVNQYASEIQCNIAAGSYMVQVVGYDPTIAGLYSLEIADMTPVVYDGVEVEPNDSAATATSTGVLGATAKRFSGALGANTVVFSGTCDTPAVPPVVYSGVAVAPATLYSGTVGTYPLLPAITPTILVTPSVAALSLPAANPVLASYTPGMNLVMTGGVNAGLARLISASTANTITTAAFGTPNTAGSTFDIVTVNTTTVTWVNSLPVASMFTGNLGYSMVMTSGANVGLIRTISAGTGPSAFGSALTTAAWPVANAPGDTFDVICTGSNQAIRVLGGGLTPNAWNPNTGGSSLGYYHIRFTSGANAGLYRQIRSNTGSTITTETTLTAAPAAGDTFVVEKVDADYYQVVLTAPTTAVWFQINEGDNGMVYGCRYEIYDAAGNALLPATSAIVPAFGTQSGTSSSLTLRTSLIRTLPAGTYNFAIRPAQTPFTAAATMPGGVVPAGPYMLEIFAMPMDVGGTVNEVEAPGVQANNTAATAQAIVPGQIVRGNVTASTGADPTDWYGPIVITQPSLITYQTRRNSASATPMLDSTLILRDGAGAAAVTSTTGNLLDTPSSSTSGLHGRASVSFFAPGNYYIEVGSPGTTALPAMFGDYELQVSVVVAPPYVTGSFASVTSNAACGTAPQPLLTRQFTAEVPVTGSWFSRQITQMTPNFIGLDVIGFAQQPAPLDLALLFGGTPSACFLNITADIINTVLTDVNGVVELGLSIPSSTALRGTIIWEQAVDFDVSAPNGFSAQPGNFVRWIVGERSY